MMQRSLAILSRFILATTFVFGGFTDLSLAGTKLRIMAANLTSGRYQSYDPGHGLRIIKGLKPDIVLIQEFKFGDNSNRDLRQFVDDMLGPDYEFYREESRSASLPNGVISAFPIINAGEWRDPNMNNRGFAWAQIRLPDGRDVWTYSVHFSAKRSGTRSAQARELVRLIKQQVNPEHDLVVIGGDLNTGSRGESAVQVLFDLVGEESLPVCPQGKSGTNHNRNKPYDWIMANDAMDQYAVGVDLRSNPSESRIDGKNYFPDGLIYDTRAFNPNPFPGIIDPSDSNVFGMQHMGVVKDFEIN